MFGDIIMQIKDNEMAKYLDSMSADERQNCMKWVYRCMAIAATTKNCPVLLKWHSAIYDKDGVGSILRVMVDRKL